MASTRKHRLQAGESPSRPAAKRSDADEQQSPWRFMRAASSLAAAASAARLAAAAAFRSPPRFAAAPGAGASGGELRSQPRKLKFGEAATLPTAPAPSHEGRMLAPDATLPEVAAFLCDGAHNFDAEPPEAPKPTEDATLPRRALDWRGLLEARLGSASLVRRNQAEAMAAMLLGRDVEHLAPTGSGKTLVFEMDALAGELTVVVSPLQALIRSQSAALQARLDGAGAVCPSLPCARRAVARSWCCSCWGLAFSASSRTRATARRLCARVAMERCPMRCAGGPSARTACRRPRPRPPRARTSSKRCWSSYWPRCTERSATPLRCMPSWRSCGASACVSRRGWDGTTCSSAGMSRCRCECL